jgi:hypothetical protein
MPQPIQYDSAHLDLSARFFSSSVVAGTPALAAETTICTLTLVNDLAIGTGVYLFGWCAFTMGTSGTGATMKIRRTSTAGTTIVTGGITLGVATGIYQPSIMGLDPNPVPNTTVYVLTLTIQAGGAASTVSAAQLTAVAV